MTYKKSLAISSTLVAVSMIALLLYALMAGADINVPLVMEATSGNTAQGKPEATLAFSPLGPALAIIVLSVALWSLGRLRGRES